MQLLFLMVGFKFLWALTSFTAALFNLYLSLKRLKESWTVHTKGVHH